MTSNFATESLNFTMTPSYASLQALHCTALPECWNHWWFCISLQAFTAARRPASYDCTASAAYAGNNKFNCWHMQVAKFLSQNGGAARPQSTYILELGVNDYIEVVSGIENVTVSAVIQTINQILNTLYNAGARK